MLLEYVDSDDVPNRLSTLREPIIQGDFRSLHIAWLASIALKEGAPDNDEVQELPPPPGLNKLDFGLRALAEFFAMDLNLIAAAARSAPSAESKPLASAIPSLTRDEMESHLTNIVNGEAGAVALLKNNWRKNWEMQNRPPRHCEPWATSFGSGIKSAGRNRHKRGAKRNGREFKGWNNSLKRKSRHRRQARHRADDDRVDQD